MRGIRLNEEYARRRNNEDSKIAKSREVDQYFDKWNRITSRCGLRQVSQHLFPLFVIYFSQIWTLDWTGILQNSRSKSSRQRTEEIQIDQFGATTE